MQQTSTQAKLSETRTPQKKDFELHDNEDGTFTITLSDGKSILATTVLEKDEMCYRHLKMLGSKEHDWQISMAECDNVADAVGRFLKETREKLNLNAFDAFTDDYIISSYPPCFSPKKMT